MLTRRRCDGGRRQDAMVLNPLGKVETAREGADSDVRKEIRCGSWSGVHREEGPNRHHQARLPRVRPIESAMAIDKCAIDASITRG